MRALRDRRLAELEDLYRRRFDRFLRVATAIVGEGEQALEVVQEAFAQAIRDRGSFRGEGPLEAWVWRAVVNAARKELRRGHSLHVDANVVATPNGSEPSDFELGALIALLPERQRHALFLRYYADLDYRSIAEALGIEVGTVSATLSSAHAFLRRALKEVPR